MGIQNGTITFSGKIGNLRGSKWKGTKTVAQQPSGYNDANTPTQQMNRRKFAKVVEVGRQFLPAIKLGLKNVSVGKTEMNTFAQINLPAVTDNGTISTLPLEDVTVAKGNAKNVSNIATQLGSQAGSYKLGWDNNSDGGAGLSTDIVCVCDVCNQEEDFFFQVTTATRADGQVTINRGASHQGHTFDTYVFFKRAGSNEVSDSVHILTEAN